MACKIILAYPDYTMPFDIYTDVSSRQLGAAIMQNNKPVVFFSQKVSEVQQKYSVMELELLSKVEYL